MTLLILLFLEVNIRVTKVAFRSEAFIPFVMLKYVVKMKSMMSTIMNRVISEIKDVYSPRRYMKKNAAIVICAAAGMI